MDEYLTKTGRERLTIRITPDLRREIERCGDDMAKTARRLIVAGLQAEREQQEPFTRPGAMDHGLE